ncbi:MAG: inositol-3-phosphate synthase, partial [Pirellulales bacterium]
MSTFVREQQLAHLVVINVASTEPPVETAALPKRWAELDKLIDKPRRCGLPASSLYAIAALDQGHSYINFTPSLGSGLPAIDELARERGTRHIGCDGKT